MLKFVRKDDKALTWDLFYVDDWLSTTNQKAAFSDKGFNFLRDFIKIKYNALLNISTKSKNDKSSMHNVEIVFDNEEDEAVFIMMADSFNDEIDVVWRKNVIE